MHPNPADYVAELKRTGQKPARPEVSHRFVGLNYLLTESDLPANLVTFLRGGHPPGGIATDAWKADLKVQQGLIFDLLQQAADLTIQAPETAQPGQDLTLDLVVTNSGAGHNLPTGPLDQRFMWLELRLTTAAGQEIYHSGWFNEQTGEVDPESVMYLKILRNKKGQPITRHILFSAATLEYTRKPIPPQASDTVPYTIELPANVQGPLTVEAKLWYKLALQEIVKYNVKLDVIVPPVRLAETSLEIPLRR